MVKRERVDDGDDDDDVAFNEYKVGSIVKVICHNFVTYTDVEFRPGPSLNMIIGPNGSGKSTLVCAICLGLGGRPSVLNRAKEIKDFVRNGCESGWVEVHLRSASGIDVIRRELTVTGNSSVWKVNGKPSAEKAVLEHVRALNIQVDNLIQFLPQERVSDFAKLTPEQVLLETEKAAEDGTLYQQHIELRDKKRAESAAADAYRTLANEVELLKRRNATIEPMVHRYREHLKARERLSMLERKLPWVRYEAARVRLQETKKERDAQVVALKEAEAANEPLTRRLNALEASKADKEQIRKRTSEAFTSVVNEVNEMMRRVADDENALRDMRARHEQEKAQIIAREKRIIEAQREIALLEEHALSTSKDIPVAGLTEAIKELTDQINKMNEGLGDQQAEAADLTKRLNSLDASINRSMSEMDKMNGLSMQRLETLRAENPQVYSAVMWFRNNKDKFREEILEPVCMHINVRDQKYAAEIENLIPWHLHTSFVASNADDFNLLIESLRAQRLPANAILASRTDTFNFPVPRDELRKLGFDAYAIDLIDAPDVIKRVLCDAARLHLVPLSKRKVDQMAAEQLCARGLYQYYAEGVSYRPVTSAYSNHVSMSSMAVTDAKLLRTGVQSERQEHLRLAIEKAREEKRQAEARRAELATKEKELQAKTASLKAEKDRLQKEKQAAMDHNKAIAAHVARLKLKREQLERMRVEAAAAPSIESIQEKHRKEEKKMITDRVARLSAMHAHFARGNEAMQARAVAVLAVTQLNAEVRRVQNEFAESTRRLLALRDAVAELNRSVEQCRAEATRLRDEAAKTGGLTDELRAQFEGLPDDEDALMGAITEARANIDVTRTENGAQTVAEYERRQATIAEQEVLLATRKTEHDARTKEREALHAVWYPRLRALVEKISGHFSEFMKKLNYVGECRIQEHEDYDKWAIAILVRFRANEELAVLAASHQSGGERSVCTILYLMSLQSMARSPFRVVDEINQGMDAMNERRVHKIIVDAASEANTSQYFLITPKLLTDLEYNSRMRIMCVYTGPHIPEARKWSIGAFMKQFKRARQVPVA